MKRVLFAFAVAVLLLETSGLAEFLRPEPCSINESSSQDDNCSSTCVRCACCSQPRDAGARIAVTTGLMPPSRSPLLAERAPDDPRVRDITHVPKARLL